jgi:hypothetical protein
VTWVGGAEGKWSTASNWSTGAVPVLNDTVEWKWVESDFSTEGWAALQVWEAGGDAIAAAMLCPSYAGWCPQVVNAYAENAIPTMASIQIGANHCSRGTLNLRTNLTVTGQLALGPSDYCGGNVNQYGHAVTAASVRIPRRYHGEYNMYGGTLTAPEVLLPRNDSGWMNPTWLGYIYFDDDNDSVDEAHTTIDGRYPQEFGMAHLNIYAGTVQTTTLKTTMTMPQGIVTLGDGVDALGNPRATLILNGDQTAKAYSLIGTGQIRSVAGDVPKVELKGGNTYITPEPATMLMIGLGALGLIRRKK